jgi:hypothetical protein
MTDDNPVLQRHHRQMFERAAEMYGITYEEGERRYDVIKAQGNDPQDPICIGCAKRPDEDERYKMCAAEEGITPLEYVVENEGTLNRTNGHYLCDMCYIKMGQPTGGRGQRWVAP